MNEAVESTSKSKFHYGYLVVLSCMLICFGPLALALSCAGIFFTPVSVALGVGKGMVTYYMTLLWIATIVFLPFAGKLFTKLDARIVTTGATLVMILAFIALSFVTALWQYLVCGFIMGLGITILLFLTTSSLINRWFKTRAGFFIGLCMAFTGIGGVVWNPIIGSVINSAGWQQAYLVEAVIAAACALPFTIFVIRSFPSDKGLLPYGDTGLAVDGTQEASVFTGIEAKKAFRTKSFILLAAFTLFINIAMYASQMTPSYISSLPIAVSLPLFAASMASVLMAASTLGKFFIGFIGDKSVTVGIVLPLACGIAGLLGYLLLGSSSAILICSAAGIGVFYALTNVILPIMTRSLFGTKDYINIYSRVSMVAAIGSLLQAPLLGTMIDATGGFTTMWITLIIVLALAAIVGVLSMKAGKNLPTEWK